jgi:NADH-quinone oxidoreductase subunit B
MGLIDHKFEDNIITTSVDQVIAWARQSSLWPMGFGLACCAIEMICSAMSRYDISRFGMEVMRPSARQADLMIVSGTVTKRMVPQIVRLYNQMPEPKYVIAMGACASGGGPFKEGYNVVSGIDKYIPVDVYVPGCPPTPEAILYGAMRIHEQVMKQSIKAVPWYRKDQRNEALVMPELGPDLYKPQDYEALKQAIEAAQADAVKQDT